MCCPPIDFITPRLAYLTCERLLDTHPTRPYRCALTQLGQGRSLTHTDPPLRYRSLPAAHPSPNGSRWARTRPERVQKLHGRAHSTAYSEPTRPSVTAWRGRAVRSDALLGEPNEDRAAADCSAPSSGAPGPAAGEASVPSTPLSASGACPPTAAPTRRARQTVSWMCQIVECAT